MRPFQTTPAMSVTQMFSLGQAELLEQAEARQRRGAGARDDQLHLGDVLADQRQAVLDGGADDDRRAVLVVVEHRDREPLAQLLLDVEALRGLDVFEVDAAEGGFQRGDDIDKLLLVGLGQLDVEDVDAGELLEQDALAFHDRLGGQGPMAPRPSTAVPLVTTATRLARAVSSAAVAGSRTISLQAAATPGE